MAKKETTWKRLKNVQAFEEDGHWSGVESTDIDVKINKTEDIIEEMDKKSAIEIVKLMSDTLKSVFPLISYCAYASGFCITDYKRTGEDRCAMWPSCSSSVCTTYTAKKTVWDGKEGKHVEVEHRLSEVHLLIAKAIDVLGGKSE